MRDELLARVKDRNDRFSAVQDDTEILGDEAKSDAERLHVIAISIDGMQVGVDMQAFYVLGWYHWFRYVSLPAGDDLHDLSEAGRLFGFLREHYPGVGPPMLADILDRSTPLTSGEKAASTYIEATGFIERFQHGAALTELDRGINLLDRAARLMGDEEARIAILDGLARALRMRHEVTGELASLGRAIAATQQILTLTTPGTTEYAAAADNLENILQIRVDQNRNRPDIGSTISLLDEAAATASNEVPHWLSSIDLTHSTVGDGVSQETGLGHDDTDRQRLSALAYVSNQATACCGNLTGFDCILIFLAWDQLQELDPEFENSLFLTLNERNQRFTARYGSQPSRLKLTRILLNLALNGSDDHASSLASKIIARMSESYPQGTPRPLLFAAAIEDGVAISVTTYNSLWIKSS